MHALLTANVRRDDEGNVKGYQGTITDVTERKKAKTLQQRVFESFPIGILYFDDNGVIYTCNERLAEILGAPKEAFVGYDMLNQVTDEEMLSAIRASVSGSPSSYEGRYTSVVSGVTKYIVARFNPLLSDDGKIIGGVGTIEDITERKRAEEELDNYRDHLEELVKQRTAELGKEVAERKIIEVKLRQNMDRLEQFNKFAVDREIVMTNLKREINSLLIELGKEKKYPGLI